MTHKPVCQLPCDTVRLIGSTQIITSVSTAVKELVENSLDAGARNIQVRMDNVGLGNIEVKDDGHGVTYDNVARMFLHGYTSKIRQFNDLSDLESYGFRGEALAALCNLGKVTITTKATNDLLAMTYTIDGVGNIVSSKASHLNKGTVISIANLFGNLPVRKQFMSSKKKMTEELKKVEQVVQSLSIVHPEIRMTLTHNQNTIWQKNAVGTLKQSFMQVVGLRTASKLDHLNELNNDISIDLLIPKNDLKEADSLFTSTSHSVYIYVNRRPIINKEISKVLMEHIFHHFNHLNPSNKYALCLISILVLPQLIDVNLEPNKTKILLKNQNEIIALIDDVMSNYYGHKICRAQIEEEEVEEKEEDISISEDPAKKRPRLNEDLASEIIIDIFSNKKNPSTDLIAKSLDVPEENAKMPSQSSLLCSQINSENCVLTTEKEVKELNVFLKDNTKSVTNVNSFASDIRMKERDDIQSKPVEKPTLPDWPCRNLPERNEVTFNESQNSTVYDDVEIINESIYDNYEKNEESSLIQEIVPDVQNWSKGLMNCESGPLEGGAALLQPPVLESQPSQSSQESLLESQPSQSSQEPLSQDLAQFDLSMQSVSSQMGKKEMSSFTKFAKIMRPKILQEYPNIVFTKVASLLVDRWKELTLQEKRYYERLAKAVDQGRKDHKENKKSIVPELKPPRMTVPKVEVKDIFNRLKQKIEKKRPPRKEVSVPISFDKIKTMKRPGLLVDKSEFTLIGQLKPSGNWLYRLGLEIGHVRHGSLQELVISEKMLANHNVSRTELKTPISIREEMLGTPLWEVLLSLETEYDEVTRRHVVTDEVVSRNGFQIEFEKSEDSGTVTSVSMTQVASVIPHFGITELKDALGKYQKHGETAGLKCWRPMAVQNYITNEAIRVSQEAPRAPDRADLQNLLDTWEMCLKHLPAKCPHDKDIFVPFYYLEK